ncbi:MAG: 5'/3'-nucleotidase SurE [Acidimicrobiales bacterium]
MTNDDGIRSPGIHVLAAALHDAGHEVLVVAPSQNWSGAGAAIGDALGNLRDDGALPIERVTIDQAPDIECWGLDGPPALTVVAARLGAFGPPPDVVVSGINAGLNTGRSILHSGTVGAALTGQNFGISGLAVSVEAADWWHWDTAAQLAVEVLPLVVDGPPRCVINLNVPALPRTEVKGVRWTRLAPFGAVRASITGRSDDGIHFELVATGQQPTPDTDQGAVQEGWASITTLVGIAEAWPETDAVRDSPDGLTAADGIEAHLAPGAPLEPVHVVPGHDGDHRLVRPLLGDTLS